MPHFKNHHAVFYFATAEDAAKFQPDAVPITDAEAVAIIAANIPSPTIPQQIAAIELAITPRRIREALMGLDNGWLADKDAEIAALRAQL